MSTQHQQQPFKFPKIYNFPPFFTKQPHAQTYATQLQQWIQLILDYCRYNRVWILNEKGVPLSQGNVDQDQSELTSQDLNSSTTALDDEDADVRKKGIFVNDKISRSLDTLMIQEIFQELITSGNASYVNNKRNANAKTYYIHWNTPSDWSTILLNWIESKGQSGTVFTFYELCFGDLSIGQEFYGIHPDILELAINVLVDDGRARLLKDEDGKVAGVKIQ
ncbi:hypothetical protein WICPIJ_004689 [Wickerhamomyces pijperi]|uniref:Vacuolar protein-sorting-associated protein 25 n=1 Tax=Wickerhamomyces pijperi TaxID=599730 RepID=A0A9P8Q512_WICPI|nr:hypothetical protein WICPIJ_004689 [Wickerhamomyces pijperi]